MKYDYAKWFDREEKRRSGGNIHVEGLLGNTARFGEVLLMEDPNYYNSDILKVVSQLLDEERVLVDPTKDLLISVKQPLLVYAAVNTDLDSLPLPEAFALKFRYKLEVPSRRKKRC
ncbi:MAG: hypothetical protein ACRECH_15140 [Nitrososphaerales archaeon]